MGRKEKYDKNFDGYNLLQKHLKAGACDTENNFECDQCTPYKWFKKRDTMLTHLKTYHTVEIPKLKCKQCHKLYGSKLSLEQHEIIHRGLAVLKKARAESQTLTKIATSETYLRKRKGQPMSKSTPAKLIPAKLIQAKSPKRSSGKGRGGKGHNSGRDGKGK